MSQAAARAVTAIALSRPAKNSRITSLNSRRLAIVEPMMWTCFQNTGGMSVSPTGPEVEPHVTSRPPPLSEPIESFQVAAPTFSKTTSTPRLSVASKTAFAHWVFVV